MNKTIDIETFYQYLDSVCNTYGLDDRLSYYEELLETGSVEIEDSDGIKWTFTIESFQIENDQNDAELLDEDIKEIDAIVKSDVDDDPIDFELLELESNEIDDDGRELTEQEIMEIGYNPWTNEKVSFDSLLKTVDDFIKVSKEMVERYSEKEGFTTLVEMQRERIVHFNFMKTIIIFYQDKVKLQASDGVIK